MSENREKIHNLDELFGKHKPIIIIWEDTRYPLKHPDSFNPEETQRFDRLRKEADSLFHLKSEEELSDQDARLLGKTVRELVDLLNPDLAERLTFNQQVNVALFYAEAVREEMGDQEKKTIGSLTGEQSTPS